MSELSLAQRDGDPAAPAAGGAARVTTAAWAPAPRRRTGIRWAAALVILALAAGAAWWWGIRPEPGATPDSSSLVTAPVERRTLIEGTTVRGTASYARSGSVDSPRAGIVTSVTVTAGATVDAGDVLFKVEGRRVVAASGNYPYWRSLRVGDSGIDVRQLQQALDDAGVNPGPVDGRFGRGTRAALIRWQKEHGLPADGVLDPATVAVGNWPARVGTVTVATGEAIATGSEAFTLTRPSMTVSVDLTPAQASRVEVGDPVEVTVGGRMLAGEVARIAAVATTGDNRVYPASVALAAPVKAVDGATLSADITLDRAEDALVVPVAALVQDGSGAPTVRVRGTDGSVRQVAVETGIQSGAYVAVSGPLEAGEDVVIGPS